MAGITREQIDRLENYVLATGIRGRRRWEQDWDYRVSGMSEEELEARNKERRTVMELLGDFPAQMAVRNRTLREYANALVDLMERCDLEEKLRNRAEALQKAGNQEEAEEYEQVASNKSVSVVGVNPPSDIASGRIAEMRRRSMSCIA